MMEGSDAEVLSPWISTLTRPRATIQQIADTDPEKHVLGLARKNGPAILPYQRDHTDAA